MSLAAFSSGGRGRGGLWKADAIVNVGGQAQLRGFRCGLGNYRSAFRAALFPQLQRHWQRVDVDPFPPHFLIAASVRSVNAKIQVTAGIEENWLRFAKEALIQLKVVSLVYALCSAVGTARLRRHGRPLGNSSY
jgi:hypothetical protein